MKALLVFLAVLPLIQAQTEPFGSEICRLFADDVQLLKPGSCNEYVTCKGGKSVVTTCDSDKFYDKDKKTCVTKVTGAHCSDPCTAKSPNWVADPKSCNGFYRCIDKKGTFGECPSDLDFNQEAQSCVYKQDSICEGYPYCQVVPNDVPFKDESKCNEYFMCVKGNLTSFLCDRGYYDPQLGCINKAEVVCDEHPTPITVCGTPKKPIWNTFVNDERTCRGYYYCDDKGDSTPDPNPAWGQCPVGTFFVFNDQACVAAADVACTEDRCDGRNRPMVISGTLGCQHYLLCSGDVTVGEEKCDSGMYFDDRNMECTTTVQRYNACS